MACSRTDPILLVTGFERFGPYSVNPSAEVTQALDGRQIRGRPVRGLVLPVHRSEAVTRLERALDVLDPAAIVQLGLAAGRARIALERVAVNLLDYPIPDNGGGQPRGEPCVPGGPAAYWSRLPLERLREVLAAAGIPACLSSTAGTFVCNQVMYWTLHRLAARGAPTPAGLIHLPLLPAMVAAADTEAPSMEATLMVRAVELVLEVVVGDLTT